MDEKILPSEINQVIPYRRFERKTFFDPEVWETLIRLGEVTDFIKVIPL